MGLATPAAFQGNTIVLLVVSLVVDKMVGKCFHPLTFTT